MAHEYKSTWWSVELPQGWQADSNEACVTFITEQGIGALQISAYRRDNENVTDKDLNDFAEDELSKGLTRQEVSYGNFTGISVTYIVAERYWRKWWLRSDSLLLHITYNCASAEHEIEKPEELIKALRAG